VGGILRRNCLKHTLSSVSPYSMAQLANLNHQLTNPEYANSRCKSALFMYSIELFLCGSFVKPACGSRS
jgi:hypothetical protein